MIETVYLIAWVSCLVILLVAGLLTKRPAYVPAPIRIRKGNQPE